MTFSLTKSLAVAALLSLPLAATANAAETYKLDPAHTTVIWDAVHFGFSSPHGLFPLIDGSIVLDDKAPENSKVDATITTANLVTGNPKFDTHLKSKDFFNVEKFTTAKFVSTKVEKTGDKTAKVTGDLTLLGVTKPITLDVTLNQKAPNAMTKVPTVGFSAKGTIKRSDYGLNYALPAVSDNINILIEAEGNSAAE